MDKCKENIYISMKQLFELETKWGEKFKIMFEGTKNEIKVLEGMS